MSTLSQADQKAQNGGMLTTTVTVPKALWKRVKIAATENETSAQAICADGLELALKKLAARKGKPS